MIKEITKEFIIKYLKEYYKNKKIIPTSTNKEHPFCSSTVYNKFGSWNQALTEACIPIRMNKSQEVKCKNCDILFKKLVNQINKTNNNFCSSNCSGTYNNQHRKTGIRISKLEVFLQENLNGYEFSYNNRVICNGLELDIFIPNLKLAFEISGIVHYKPIYGEEKFNKIIRKDKLKMELCINNGINLIVIKDESTRFGEKYGDEILSRIYNYIHKVNFKNVLEKIRINV